jgi:CRISPR-associated exonuclease Cas4
VQLCAQALCLEEMYNCGVETGALYYGEPRRRTEVQFSGALRRLTRELAERMHKMYREGKTPRATWAKKCESCSLLEICLPGVISQGRPVAQYMANGLKEEDR